MAINSHGHGTHIHGPYRLRFWPTTQLGWWAAALAGASIVLIPSWKLMGSAGAIPGLSCGFAGGSIALVAIFRQEDRAISVVASLVPFTFAVAFVLAELTIGHS